ncbi:MAG TPA: DUF2085 domain-containing protein [Anaerolineales bacterium]|nr:DUF2085 domain-containing protein [Anaerolineales bacterium]
MDQTQALPASASPSRTLLLLVAGLAALVFISWLLNTPSGLLGKADAVGYAICHRIGSHSFYLGDRQLPLCARCTGIYLGALMGMATLGVMGRTRVGGFPRRGVLLVLFGFIAAMGVDGVNSYLTFFPNLPHLYEPRNWLRLTTGVLDGITLSALIYPVFNQTVWKNWEDRPIIGSFRELGWLVLLGLGLVGLVLTENPVILYPLALLSSVGVVVLLTAIFTAVVLILARRTNRVEGWGGLALPVLAGFTLAMLQIGVVDAARFAVFQSWGGFPFPG